MSKNRRVLVQEKCRDCNGTGYQGKQKCPVCNGKKYVNVTYEVEDQE